MGRMDADRRGVKSDETLFSLVEYLHEADGAGVTELATHTGLAKSTVHGHLTTMREYGFVVKEGDEYRLGLQFFRHGQYVRNQYGVYHVAKPVVDELVEETGEMAWLLTHENGRVMYLYGRGGKTDVNVNSLIGSWAHMHCNSGGKAILSRLPDDEVEAIVDRQGLPAKTANTITDRDALFEELERTRERGYALNLSEDLTGIHAVGVPLVHGGTVKGALAIAGPAHRVTRERCEEELAELLWAATNDVTLNLAYK